MKSLYQFISSLGFFKGILVYLKLKIGQTSKITVPAIKFPFSLRRKTSDIQTFKQIFIAKEYDILLDNPELIIDCGANIGLFSIFIKNRYKNSKIICIEPDPENFNLLKKNVSGYDRVYCENCGIWNKDTLLKVFDKYNRGKWGMTAEEDLTNGNIQGISINSLMEKHAIDYIDVLKIDIETSEKQLFRNNFEGWLPKVKLIIIELHDWIEKGCSKPFFEAINKSFESYKYSHKGGNVLIENTAWHK